MEHQDWTVVTIKRTPKKEHNVHNSSSSHSSHSSHNLDAVDIIKKKCVVSESLQELIRKRIEMKLNQEKADQLCAFPVNTFKNIESKRQIPTDKQHTVIQKKFGIQLKIEIV